eukprot:gene2794-3474_t
MTDDYTLFRSWVAKQKVSLGGVREKVWKYYDFGPKDQGPPLVFISPGTAEIYYKQFVSLCPKGFRCISVQFSPYDSLLGWVKGFDRFLDKLELDQIHIFGSSLGGYLAQCYYQSRPSRVLSLILNNSFCDTQYYHDNASCSSMFSLLPEFMLKRIILSNFPTGLLEPDIAEATDFMVEQVESLTSDELASRLSLNCEESILNTNGAFMNNITIIDTLDSKTVPEKLREEVYKYYPDAKIALIKTGGDFSYITRASELNIHIQVHLRNFGLDPLTSKQSNDSENKNNDEKTTDNNNNNNNTKVEEDIIVDNNNNNNNDNNSSHTKSPDFNTTNNDYDDFEKDHFQDISSSSDNKIENDNNQQQLNSPQVVFGDSKTSIFEEAHE